MIQILKYLIAFFLGCLFIAHNPSLSNNIINVSENIRSKIVEYTGKASREVDRKKEIAENKAKSDAEAREKAAAEDE